jgi:hypothetical protein
MLVLRHENQVLPRQLRGRRSAITAPRLWLAALSRLAHCRRWGTIPLAPAMLLRWRCRLVAHRWTYTDGVGRTTAHRRFDQDVDRVDSTPPVWQAGDTL